MGPKSQREKSTKSHLQDTRLAVVCCGRPMLLLLLELLVQLLRASRTPGVHTNRQRRRRDACATRCRRERELVDWLVVG